MNTTALLHSSIELIPSYISVHTIDSTIIQVNNKTANDWGFKDADQVNGISYENLPCKAAEFHHQFYQTDQQAIKAKKPIQLLSYLSYANDNWVLGLGSKSPIIDDDGEVKGVVANWMDITDYNLIDLSRFLLSDQKKLRSNIQQKQFVYHLDQGAFSKQLTKREDETLFFLIRGKTAREIGDLLFLSPRTIDMHIESLKDKFICQSKPQLIEKTILNGYMNYLPTSLIETCSYL